MRNIQITIAMILGVAVSSGQNVINPYLDYSTHPMPNYTIFSSSYEHTSIVPNCGNFNGEYMISFDLLWWFQNYPLGGQNFINNYYKSFNIEVVGFPFAPNCAWTAIGCADGSTTDRILEMPNFTLSGDEWAPNLWRKREHIAIDPISFLTNEQAGLISIHYNDDQYLPTTGQPYYPHSTHKISLFLHCGPLSTDEIGDTLIFLYDHTRGRMRDYPFITQNSVSAGGPSDWDLHLRPRLIYKDFGPGHFYNETTNSDIFNNGKTLNYFPFEDGNLCETIDESYYFYAAPDLSFLYSAPAPYALSSCLLYTQYSGSFLAGYNLSNGLLVERPGIEHTYYIQNNFNLSEINPDEKIIYNPSEVNITATDLIFPSGYTFKTIRGVYPTEVEAMADNLSDNGGPFADPLDIPVKTDLYSENPADPSNNTLYASRYYLKSGSKLTIQPCVKVFDAVFDAEAGSTLVIDDYQNMIGKEDISFYSGRYKIQGLGGAVLRNRANTQYVHNGTITQTIPLHYTALDMIIAGREVADPDLDQNSGDFILEANSNVSFQAQNLIKLVGGFQAKSGSSFHAFCSEVESYELCEPEEQRLSQIIKSNNSKKSGIPLLKIHPNPAINHINLSGIEHDFGGLTIVISDISGKETISILQDSQEVKIFIDQLQTGIYSLRVMETGQSAKFVKL